jgi:hypothetical protein
LISWVRIRIQPTKITTNPDPQHCTVLKANNFILQDKFVARIFAGFIHGFVRDYNALCNPFKEQLFAELNSMKPAEGKVKRSELLSPLN